MLCVACKTPVPDNARQCPACGTPAPSTPAPSDDRTEILATIPLEEEVGSDTQLRPGASFGTRYRIEKLLGEGGMGAVYKALDTEVSRTVAPGYAWPRPFRSTDPLYRWLFGHRFSRRSRRPAALR